MIEVTITADSADEIEATMRKLLDFAGEPVAEPAKKAAPAKAKKAAPAKAKKADDETSQGMDAANEGPSADDCQQAAKKAAEKHSGKTVRDYLKKEFEVEKLADLPEDKRQAFIDGVGELEA